MRPFDRQYGPSSIQCLDNCFGGSGPPLDDIGSTDDSECFKRYFEPKISRSKIFFRVNFFMGQNSQNNEKITISKNSQNSESMAKSKFFVKL